MWTVKKKKLRFDNACNPISDKEVRICKDVVRGSLTLHSDRNAYKDGVLYYKWSVEDQPKDNDFKTACPRNLHRSTYRRLGCSLDPTAKSVYTLTNDEFIIQKEKPIPKISHRDVSKNDDSTYLMFEREKKVACESGLKYILPHFYENPRKFRSLTTSIDHFRPPLPLIHTTSTKTKAQLEKDKEMEKWLEYHTACVKKTTSQFTDLGGIKRSGIHTWLDESGCYPNTCLRSTHPYYIRKESPFVVRVV